MIGGEFKALLHDFKALIRKTDQRNAYVNELTILVVKNPPLNRHMH